MNLIEIDVSDLVCVVVILYLPTSPVETFESNCLAGFNCDNGLDVRMSAIERIRSWLLVGWRIDVYLESYFWHELLRAGRPVS